MTHDATAWFALNSTDQCMKVANLLVPAALIQLDNRININFSQLVFAKTVSLP